jgi:hypothetical protein
MVNVAPDRLAPSNSSLLADLLAKALAIQFGHTRAVAVVGIAPYLPEDLLAKAWAAMRRLGKDWHRREAVVSLAPYLPHPLLLEGLAVAQEMEEEDERTMALAALIPVLSEPWRSQVLDEALLAEGVAAAKSWRKRGRSRTLCALAPYQPEALMAEALTAARGASESWAIAEAMAGLAPYLSESLLP